MDFFDEASLRLKQQLKVTDDKQVAEVLGFRNTAWSARKKRGSFPVKAVFALAAQRPELGLDPDWVINGTSGQTESNDEGEADLLKCYRLMNARDRKNINKIASILSDYAKAK